MSKFRKLLASLAIAGVATTMAAAPAFASHKSDNQNIQVDTATVPTPTTTVPVIIDPPIPVDDGASDEHDFVPSGSIIQSGCDTASTVTTVTLSYVTGQHPAALKNPRWIVDGNNPIFVTNGDPITVTVDESIALHVAQLVHNNADPDDIKTVNFDQPSCPIDHPAEPQTVRIDQPVVHCDTATNIVKSYDVTFHLDGKGDDQEVHLYRKNAEGVFVDATPTMGSTPGDGFQKVNLQFTRGEADTTDELQLFVNGQQSNGAESHKSVVIGGTKQACSTPEIGTPLTETKNCQTPGITLDEQKAFNCPLPGKELAITGSGTEHLAAIAAFMLILSAICIRFTRRKQQLVNSDVVA